MIQDERKEENNIKKNKEEEEKEDDIDGDGISTSSSSSDYEDSEDVDTEVENNTVCEAADPPSGANASASNEAEEKDLELPKDGENDKDNNTSESLSTREERVKGDELEESINRGKETENANRNAPQITKGDEVSADEMIKTVPCTTGIDVKRKGKEDEMENKSKSSECEVTNMNEKIDYTMSGFTDEAKTDLGVEVDDSRENITNGNKAEVKGNELVESSETKDVPYNRLFIM